MDQEREDSAEPSRSPAVRRELAWAVGLFLTPALVIILLAVFYVLGMLHP